MTAESYDPEQWAEAVRQHQRCLAEWDARARRDPGVAQTFHGADHHLPRRCDIAAEEIPADVTPGRYVVGETGPELHVPRRSS